MAESAVETTEYESGGLALTLVAPPPDLVPYVSAYYLTQVADDVVVEDWLPPEEANLRTGKARIYEAAIGTDPLIDVPSVILSGPTDRVARLRVSGGMFWGIGLTPAGWARFIRNPASAMVNRFEYIAHTDVDGALKTMLEDLRDNVPDVAAAAAMITRTFRALLGPRPLRESAIHEVHLSLLSPEAAAVRPIAVRHGMNPRTFERFCKRHFGFTPSVLLRRQRFLRSLGKYMLDPSMRWIHSLDTHYWDQAHFIRDFRATMNMTPGEYAALPHPIITAAVAVTAARSGVTMQALYHPDLVTADETGL